MQKDYRRDNHCCELKSCPVAPVACHKMLRMRVRSLFFLMLVHKLCAASLASQQSRPSINSRFGDAFSSTTAAENAIKRVIGTDKATSFDLKIIKDMSDGFMLLKNSSDKKVLVSGPNTVSLVWGVHYYLKNYCNSHISWDGDQVVFPMELPNVNKTIISMDKFRFYQNVCTYSYSFVWWDWARWEREIDWMAFNGINLALAFTGQEAIWQRAYDALGLEYTDFTGPAFLAWNRMGNLRNFSQGLTSNWLRQQLSLQHKILQRFRDLGITPVLPAFCGIVPRSFARAYPEAKLTKMPRWGKFSDELCCPYLLDPTDILFSVTGRIFLREYINEFGTNNIYNCDAFNENRPYSGNLEYLANISKSIFGSMSSVDPNAVWLLQGWMFIDPFWADTRRAKAFLTAVPKGKMLILDLQSDLTPQYKRLWSYFGHPFIWCTLHNFGGQLGMYGHIDRINKGIPDGRRFKNSTMVGVGIAPEGIDQNYVVYAFTLDSAFRVEPDVQLNEWIARYARRRYGTYEGNVTEAWVLLLNTLYNYEPKSVFRATVSGPKRAKLFSGQHISKNILTRLPSLHMSEPYWYNRSIVFDIFEKFLAGAEDDRLRASSLFQHDLIDVSRQTIQAAVGVLYFTIVKSYAKLDAKAFRQATSTFLDILDELDVVLGSGRKFLLGSWLEKAKAMAASPMEKTWYEFNARNQITLWGPNGEIRDYAAKQWAGLVGDFYRPRWRVFLEALNCSLKDKIPFNSSAVKEDMFTKVEKPFGLDRKTYPTEPRGNPIQVTRQFGDKWRQKLYKIFHGLG